MILLLQAVHIIPIAVCVCKWSFFCCMCILSLLQSVSVHDPSSAVCAYYPYCSLCLYMILLLLYVHIIWSFCCMYILSLLQSVHVTTLLLQTVHVHVHIIPNAVFVCTWPSFAVCTYYPYCSLCLYMILLLLSVHIIWFFFCCMYTYYPYFSLYMSQLYFCRPYMYTCTYNPYCCLRLYMTFFCCPYILPIMQFVSVHDPSSAVCTK